MKLFKIATKEEGGATPDAFIAMGKCIERKRQLGGMFGMDIFDDQFVQNGWYVKVTLPFSIRQKSISPESFEMIEGPHRPTFFFRARRPRQEGKMTYSKMTAWVPK
jgi:hypothetical protein